MKVKMMRKSKEKMIVTLRTYNPSMLQQSAEPLYVKPFAQFFSMTWNPQNALIALMFMKQKFQNLKIPKGARKK